jgi:hypothetical protein
MYAFAVKYKSFNEGDYVQTDIDNIHFVKSFFNANGFYSEEFNNIFIARIEGAYSLMDFFKNTNIPDSIRNRIEYIAIINIDDYVLLHKPK